MNDHNFLAKASLDAQAWERIFIRNFIVNRHPAPLSVSSDISSQLFDCQMQSPVQNKIMRIEAVIVCKDYSDFLEHSLKENIQHLDRIVVVTHPNDKATQLLCTKFGVDFVDTEVMHHNGDKFNKGRAINLGLSHLRHDDWLLHLDADIVLPHGFRKTLQLAHLEKEKVYGCDRLNTKSFEHWMAHKDKGVPQHQWRYMVTPQAEFPLGSRLLHQEYGYCPIGFFQLWHSSAGRKYPIVSGSAEHSDVLFAVQWARKHRILLPEIFVYHLESEQGPMGQNWEGRRSKHFGPKHHHHAPHCKNPDKPYCK